MLSDHSAPVMSAFSEEVCLPRFKVFNTSNSALQPFFLSILGYAKHQPLYLFSCCGFCNLNMESGMIFFYRSECCYPFYFLALEA